jgi:LacI family transcriptional regulator
MAKSTHVTLEDIANTLGITKVTVSKSLRDHPDISTETKQKVKEKANELGYRRNRLAQSLTLNKTNTIGVIVPKISHTFFSDTLEGINEVAYTNDYEIVLCVSDEKEEREKSHVDTLLSMQVDGLLISVSEETSTPDHLQEITNQGVPLVLFDRRIDGVEASCVTVDDQGGAYEATEHALEQGLETIVHMAGYSNVNIGQNRRAGYENALRDHGITPSDEWIIEGGFGEADGYWGGVEMIDRGLNPDAIFAVTFPVALGVEDALRQKRPSIRESLHIYSFGQHELNRFFSNPHTSVHQPAKKIGSEAMSLLLKQIDDPDADIADVELPTHVVDVQHDDPPPYLNDET